MLGVPRDASEDQIKPARKFHPDVNPGDYLRACGGLSKTLWAAPHRRNGIEPPPRDKCLKRIQVLGRTKVLGPAGLIGLSQRRSDDLKYHMEWCRTSRCASDSHLLSRLAATQSVGAWERGLPRLDCWRVLPPS